MFATVDILRSMNFGDTIVVADDSTDSYTKIPKGMYKGLFESHLYFGQLYGVEELAEQLDGCECTIISASSNKKNTSIADGYHTY